MPSNRALAVLFLGIVSAPVGCVSHSQAPPPVAERHAITAAAAGASIDVEYIEAQRFEDPLQDARLIYPVKFVCGEAGSDAYLTPAHYRTLINVLNPSHNFSRRIQWWFVTLEQTVQGAQAVVPQTGSLVMDCEFILANLANAGMEVDGLVEGFVLLEEEADRNFFRVSAVYSTLHKQRHDLPDLVPVQRVAGYCNLDSERRLLVTIGNVGEAAAGPSTAGLTFEDGTRHTRPTPTLALGGQANLDPIPLPDVGEGTLRFTIEADSLEQVLESNELNNRAMGFCTIID